MILRPLAATALASLAAVACAPSEDGSRSADEHIQKASAASIESFTSDASGFDTHSFWVDTGAEVVVFDAQFTPALADKVIADIQAKTSRPIAWVVITHPNPDKFQGAAPFRALGAKVIASRRTADAIPAVHAYKKHYFTEVAKMFTPETYPELPVIDVTFEGTFRLPVDVAIELHELENPGVTTTQTVAWIPTSKALIVGDLVHHQAHAWLEGGIVDGAPRPDLEAWKRALGELLAFPDDTTVYGGRGRPALVSAAVGDQQAYLDKLDAIVRDEVSALATPVATLASPDASAVYTKIEERAAAAFPDYELRYLIGYGAYGLAQQVAREIEASRK